MAQKRIYELGEDTEPTADHSLPIDKSGNAAATRVTITNLLQKIRVALQSYGGNARGTAAVDLQITRAAAAQVASGNYATLAGGQNNTVSGVGAAVGGGESNQGTGSDAIVAGGYANVASGAFAAIGGGSGNTASGQQAAVGGGYANQATAIRTTVGGGYANVASGSYATVPGGSLNTASGNYSTALGNRAVARERGQLALALGRFAADGDAQHSRLVLRRALSSHTDTTWYTLLLEATTQITMPADTLWTFRVMIAGLTSGAAQRWNYLIEGAIVNDGGATTLLASTVTTLYESDAAYDCQATAAFGTLDIQVRRNGGSDYNVRWVATVELCEVAYP